jgi:hypothetical protein
MSPHRRNRSCRVRKWTGRLGTLGFSFFLIEGLVWLGLTGAAAWAAA